MTSLKHQQDNQSKISVKDIKTHLQGGCDQHHGMAQELLTMFSDLTLRNRWSTTRAKAVMVVLVTVPLEKSRERKPEKDAEKASFSAFTASGMEAVGLMYYRPTAIFRALAS